MTIVSCNDARKSETYRLLEESADAIAQIVKNYGFHFHQLVEADELIDAVGVGSYPLTLVLDKEARIVLLESGTTQAE